MSGELIPEEVFLEKLARKNMEKMREDFIPCPHEHPTIPLESWIAYLWGDGADPIEMALLEISLD